MNRADQDISLSCRDRNGRIRAFIGDVAGAVCLFGMLWGGLIIVGVMQ